MDTKNIITNIFVVIAIIVLIGGFLLGMFRKDYIEELNEDTTSVMDYTGKTNKDSTNYENTEDTTEDNVNFNELEENPHGEDYSDMGEIERQEIDESKLAPSYEEHIGKKLTNETKKLTTSFIEIFYNFDGDRTKKYVEKSKEYMTDEFYESLIEEPEIPTYDTFTREYISSEIVESKAFTREDFEGMIPYIVYVNGETENLEGENRQKRTDIYTVVLIEENDKYKVNDVYVNVPYE